MIGLGVLGGAAISDASGATTPPDSTTTTTIATDGSSASVVTVAPGAAVPRGGSASGGLEQDTGRSDWDVAQLATTAALGLAALGLAGHLYGRTQSTLPPSATTPPAGAPPT